jgi:tetratricopeptide (TPR) repeat protein
MHTRYSLFIALTLTSLILMNCSSVPKDDGGRNTIKNQAAEFLDLGKRYVDEGELEQGLELLQLAYELNASVLYYDGMASSQLSLALLFANAGSSETAEEFFILALEDSLLAENPSIQTRILVNRAQFFYQTGNDSEFSQDLDTALEIFDGKDKEIQAKILLLEGYRLKSANALEEAAKKFEEAGRLFEKNFFLIQASSAYYSLASIYSQGQDYENAKITLELCLELDRKSEHTEGIVSDLIALARIARKQSDEAAVREYLETALRVSLRNTAYQETVLAVIQELEVSFD